MEDLIGFLLFLLIAAVTSIGSKQPRGKETRRRSRPVWPPQSPVPGPFDASPPPVSPAPPQTEVWQPEPVLSEESGEGTSMEGRSEEGRPTEGKEEFEAGPFQPGQNILAERQEFARHRAEFTASHLTPGFQPSIRSSIQPTVQSAAAGTDTSGPAASRHPLEAMLHDREGLARAVLLAEVLGKPKALRSGR